MLCLAGPRSAERALSAGCPCARTPSESRTNEQEKDRKSVYAPSLRCVPYTIYMRGQWPTSVIIHDARITKEDDHPPIFRIDMMWPEPIGEIWPQSTKAWWEDLSYARIKICLTFRIPPRVFSFTFRRKSSLLFICSKLRSMFSSCSLLTPFLSISFWPCSRSWIAFSTRAEKLPDGHGPAWSSAGCGGSSAPVCPSPVWLCERDM